MLFLSTRGHENKLSVSEAISQGLAPDGGLYVPEVFPSIRDALKFRPHTTLHEVAHVLLSPYFVGDRLEPELDAIIAEALNFPIPLVEMREKTALLELFHGPSAAFKDVGARFLASVVSRLEEGQEKPLTILVATSGDTGGAVAAAFHQRPNVNVIILYPDGKVSARQAHQLSCWGDNIQTLAVDGVFDDCQRIVKEAFQDAWFKETYRLSSANSINIGRLLPQACYHAWSALEYMRLHDQAPGLIIPTGNLGNAVSAIWAREMGFPIREIVFAVNANQPLHDWHQHGTYEPKPTQATLANAMDVGAPSNMERLLDNYSYADAKDFIGVESVSDREIEALICRGEVDWDQIFCPHTAVGVVARERIGGQDWIISATAHPAKFETIVEPLIRKSVPVPPPLQALLDRPSHTTKIAPSLLALREALT